MMVWRRQETEVGRPACFQQHSEILMRQNQTYRKTAIWPLIPTDFHVNHFSELFCQQIAVARKNSVYERVMVEAGGKMLHNPTVASLGAWCVPFNTTNTELCVAPSLGFVRPVHYFRRQDPPSFCHLVSFNLISFTLFSTPTRSIATLPSGVIHRDCGLFSIFLKVL